MILNQYSLYKGYIVRNKLTARDIHKHEDCNICGKCYSDIHSPRVSRHSAKIS